MVNVGKYTSPMDPMGPDKNPRLKQRADGNVAGAGAGAQQLRAIQKTLNNPGGLVVGLVGHISPIVINPGLYIIPWVYPPPTMPVK